MLEFHPITVLQTDIVQIKVLLVVVVLLVVMCVCVLLALKNTHTHTLISPSSEGKSALFEHVDLDEEEGGSKEEEIIVVEDLDVVNDVPAPVPEKQNDVTSDPDKQSTCIKDTSEVDDQESAENKQSVLNK